MSLDHELTAVPASAPKGRWREYTQLSRQIKQAGLLERRRGWYAVRIGSNLLLLAAGWVAFAVIGQSWWQLATATYLAIVFTQLAFVGHDAGHRQIFRSRRANDLAGLLHANLLVGISFGAPAGSPGLPRAVAGTCGAGSGGCTPPGGPASLLTSGTILAAVDITRSTCRPSTPSVASRPLPLASW
jgi:hypothetical protein